MRERQVSAPGRNHLSVSDPEAENLARLFEGRGPELLSFLSGQLAVLRGQGHTYLGIAGVCISVTGFSGHNMVNAGALSASSMVIGLLLVLAAIVLTLRALRRIRWVSEDLGAHPGEVVARVIARRNVQQKALERAGILVGVGLTFYLTAVVLAALGKAGWTVP